METQFYEETFVRAVQKRNELEKELKKVNELIECLGNIIDGKLPKKETTVATHQTKKKTNKKVVTQEIKYEIEKLFLAGYGTTDIHKKLGTKYGLKDCTVSYWVNILKQEYELSKKHGIEVPKVREVAQAYSHFPLNDTNTEYIEKITGVPKTAIVSIKTSIKR